MADEGLTQDGGPQDVQDGGADAGATRDDQRDLSILPDWARTEIEKTRNELQRARDEAAQRRIALREAEQARLAEQGKWKELAEKRAAEAAELVPFRERAESLEAMIRESNDRRMQAVREDMRTLVPTDYSPERLAAWLDTNWARLTARPAPNIDAGAGAGAGTSGPTLTEDELATARRLGVSPEALARQKAKRQQNS